MTLPGAPVARMLNTCSIGRRWKPREGWSRPVLTGERGTLSDPLAGSGLVLWWFLSLDGKEHCFLVVTMTIPVKRFCSRPLSGSRTATIGIVAWFRFCRPIPWWVGRYMGFAVVMAQVRRPVPFRTRKLRPGRGDGTALERVWESSTPPHSTYGPSGRAPSGFPEGPFCFRARVFSSIRWRETDAGRPVGGRIAPVTGSPGTLGDPRNFRGASCPYPMVE